MIMFFKAVFEATKVMVPKVLHLLGFLKTSDVITKNVTITALTSGRQIRSMDI